MARGNDDWEEKVEMVKGGQIWNTFCFVFLIYCGKKGFPGGAVTKNLTASAGNAR